jgi:hypothetical protein
MKIKLKKELKLTERTKKSLKKVEKELAKEVELHATKIVQNTLAGKTYDDKKLKDYEKSTARDRKRYGLQTNPPNLKRSGGLLKSIKSKTRTAGDKVKGTIFIAGRSTSNFRNRKKTTNNADKARYLLQLGFRFFGLSDKDRKKIEERIKKTFIRNW